ncbi:protein FAM13B [Bombina bombina]|uniref:protein FAM13B n=1 Tax=Bombina bombina TaxID=8345 RepID=UPI00235AE14A|nr:protein FAM13B [Bombina bombina]
MRKSSSSLGNCNIIANKIFGIALDELQQEGQPDHEVPLIVRHIVDYIEVHGGLEQEGLFQVNGNAETVEWLRQRYDNGEEVDLVKEADVPSAISLLRYFLQELPQPVIVRSLHVHFMQISQDYDNEDEFVRKLKYLLQQLPPLNYSLLKFLCRFLANVATHHEDIWPTSALAAVFGPDIFHIYTDVEYMKEQESVSRIMIGLLENYYDFFETEEEDLSSTNDLSSITEQLNDLDDVQLEESAEECREETHEEDPDIVRLEMSEEMLESSSVVASTREDTIEDDASTQYGHGSSHSVICPYIEYCDSPSESDVKAPSFQGEDMKRVADILLEMTDEDTEDDGFIDEENDIGSDRNDESFECDTDLLEAMDSSTGCDYNANSERQTLKPGNVSLRGEAASIHHLELRNISDVDQEEPFPDFKAWQGDTEYGEAQISPQAARMNFRVEDDVNPVLSHRSLDFGQSQRFFHNPDALDSSSKTLYVRARGASYKDEKKTEKTPHQLMRKLHRKIRLYEEQFESEKNFKPTYSDIAANPKVLKWITELTKLKKQVKDAKHKNTDAEYLPQTRPRSNTLPKSFGSSLNQEEEVVEEHTSEKKPSQEATLEFIMKRLKEKRTEKGMPEEMNVKMTKDNLAEEKTSLQKSLLYYESLHGRPVTREERQIVKPLYDRYRLVKQMLARASITPILGSPSSKRRGQMLAPIIEGETSHFFDEIKEEEEESGNVSSDCSDIIIPSINIQSFPNTEESIENEDLGQDKLTRETRLSSSRTTPVSELLEQLWKARAEKKKLRKSLREFEDNFYQQNARNVQKDDRAPMLEVYREYKKIKAKLRLLEVLISKQESSKSV